VKQRIYVAKAEDRDQVAVILVRNGYAVRQGREKQGNRYAWFVEYWGEQG